MSGATVLIDGARVRLCMNSWTGKMEPCRLGCQHLNRNSGVCQLSPQPPTEWSARVWTQPCIEVSVTEMEKAQRHINERCGV